MELLNKKGSTLLMVIIMVAALTILGTALISMTMMNVNMKYNDYRAKRSMYFAEAGIDEVYAVVGTYVDEALVYATDSTANYMNILIATVPTSHAIYYDDSGTNYLDGAFNQTELQKIADGQFQSYFKDFFHITHIQDNGFDVQKNLTTSISAINTSIGGHSAPNITYAAISDFTVDNPSEFNILGLTSIFTLKNDSNKDLARKTITTDIIINEPTVQYPLQVVENRIAVARNPLWQNAIVSSSGDIQFMNGTTNIIGDIYALGIPAGNALDTLDFGGVVVSRGALSVPTTVSLTGDVVSKNYVQTRGDHTTLNISDSHVYCNSLTIQETADNSKIFINNSNVYTIDDIELNGPSSEIEIDGSYYGYSFGNAFYEDSCIIINSNIDTGSGGSKITITGTTPTALGYDEDYHGIYVAGTAYVNATGDTTYGDIWPYQTGESFSLKGNYKAYKYKFDDTHPIFAANTLDFASVSGTAIEFVAKQKSSATPFNVNDKILYFTEYAKLTSSALEVGIPSSVNINLSDYSYTIGSKIGITNGALAIEGKYGDVGIMGQLSSDITDDYNFYLYRSGNSGEFTNIGNPTSSDLLSDPDILDYYTDMTGITMSAIDTSADYVLDAGTATEIIYVGTDDITIGPDSTYTYDTSNPDIGSRLQGIILTEGNVTISSESTLDFVGTIIAKGQIVIEGSGTKNFYNYNPVHSDNEEKDKYRYLIELIDKNNNLEEVFDRHTFDDVISFIQTSYVDVSTDSNSYRDRYNELIDFSNWQVD